MGSTANINLLQPIIDEMIKFISDYENKYGDKVNKAYVDKFYGWINSLSDIKENTEGLSMIDVWETLNKEIEVIQKKDSEVGGAVIYLQFKNKGEYCLIDMDNR